MIRLDLVKEQVAVAQFQCFSHLGRNGRLSFASETIRQGFDKTQPP